MQIREAIEEDIPEILSVLKESLGEVSSKKTENIWKYKHVENPFGKSLVLVAEEEGKIIGIRAFMRWKWQMGEKKFSAFRAVDTATHPEHQGKGVFKKLTLKALEIAKSRGDHFVFNTPNNSSKPGYLKMGWEEIAKLKIKLLPVNPLYFLNNTVVFEGRILKTANTEEIESLLRKYQKRQSANSIFTPKNAFYLKWRYEQNPIQDYYVLSKDRYYIAAYIKSRGNLKELRVSERICLDVNAEKKADKKIMKLSKEFGAHFISCAAGNNSVQYPGLTGNYGPVLTYKNIGLAPAELKAIQYLKNWDYSIGELEIF